MQGTIKVEYFFKIQLRNLRSNTVCLARNSQKKKKKS